MKKITVKILTVGLLAAMNSCCFRKHCIDAGEIYNIDFYNFTQAELDTVAIIGYTKSTNFAELIDSSVWHISGTGEYSFTVYTDKPINTDLDYKIKLISTGQVFTLTGFEIKKEGCNGCFPYRPKSEYYNKLKRYYINGQEQTGIPIRIYK